MSFTLPSLEIRTITSAQTLPLRHQELRPALPIEAAANPGDDDPQTVHYGCFSEGALVAIATIFPEAAPDAVAEDIATAFTIDSLALPWRLRGMAVDSTVQRSGYGKAALRACLDHVARSGGSLLWCNARTTALAFYRNSGFEVFGQEFKVPSIGPHYVMARRITD